MNTHTPAQNKNRDDALRGCISQLYQGPIVWNANCDPNRTVVETRLRETLQYGNDSQDPTQDA